MQKSLRAGRIVVTTRPGTPEDCAREGHCGWCGEPMFRVNKAGETVPDRLRGYHRAERGERGCRDEVDGSSCWSARVAVRVRAKLAGERVLRCVDCGMACEQLYPRTDDALCVCGHPRSEHAQGRLAGRDVLCRHGCDACCSGWAAYTSGFRLAAIYWEADHEVPLIDGGAHVIEKLRCRCGECHRAKTVREAKARAVRRRKDRPSPQLVLVPLSGC
jgi:hypothetical protein